MTAPLATLTVNICVTDNIIITYMIEWMHSDGLDRLATASERIRLVYVHNVKKVTWWFAAVC